MKENNFFLLIAFLMMLPVSLFAVAEHGKQLYNANCQACHTIGGGSFVGPDLENISEKRETDWLVEFIQSSQSMIRAGDEQAVAIYEEYNRLVMPNFKNLSRDDVMAILKWIEVASAEAAEKRASGPEIHEGYGAFGNRMQADKANVIEHWKLLQNIYWIAVVLICVIAITLGWFIAVVSKT